MNLFKVLGFEWNRTFIPKNPPGHSFESFQPVIFRAARMLPEFVWDAAALEENPITFAEIKSLLEGAILKDREPSDQEQILNLAESFKRLLSLLRLNLFALNKTIFCELHAIVARGEALEWGHFRGEGEEKEYTPPVALGEAGYYTPPATEDGARALQKIFSQGVEVLQNEIPSPLERGLIFFLFGAFQQFFFDGNKRTSRLMMNGAVLYEQKRD